MTFRLFSRTNNTEINQDLWQAMNDQLSKMKSFLEAKV